MIVHLDSLIDFKNLTYDWDTIKSIPEFAILESCQQSPKWHAEGNAWIHTQKVCEEAINICKVFYNTDSDMYSIKRILSAALFHDIGKGVTTHQGKDGRWHSIGHEIEGEKITRLMLWEEDWKLREDICSLVRWHMEPLNIYDRKDYLEQIVSISKSIPNWNLLIELKLCDLEGSIQEDDLGKQIDRTKLGGLVNAASNLGCLYEPSKISLKGKFPYEIYKESKEKPNINVYVLVGLPGAGKSTAISKIIESLKGQEYTVVSRDIIRAMLGYCKEGEKVVLSASEEEQVTKSFDNLVKIAAKNGQTIIIDNLNTKRKYRDAYKTLLSNYFVTWKYVYVEADSLSKNIERRSGQIEPYVFENIIKAFDWPSPSEYNSIEYIIN